MANQPRELGCRFSSAHVVDIDCAFLLQWDSSAVQKQHPIAISKRHEWRVNRAAATTISIDSWLNPHFASRQHLHLAARIRPMAGVENDQSATSLFYLAALSNRQLPGNPMSSGLREVVCLPFRLLHEFLYHRPALHPAG